MNPTDLEQTMARWPPRRPSARIGRRLFGPAPQDRRRHHGLWFAPLATACVALAASLGTISDHAGMPGAAGPVFQTNGLQITLSRFALDEAALTGARPDWNRWEEASFQSTNRLAPTSTTGQF